MTSSIAILLGQQRSRRMRQACCAARKLVSEPYRSDGTRSDVVYKFRIDVWGTVTLASDGRAGAQNGSSERVMSRVGRMSRGARPQKPQTGAHDMRQLPADGGVGGSGHG